VVLVLVSGFQFSVFNQESEDAQAKTTLKRKLKLKTD